MRERALPLRAQAERFASGFDPAFRSGRFWSRVALTTTGAVLIVLPLLAYVPGPRKVFGLQPAVPFALALLRLGLVLVLVRYERAHGTSPSYFAFAAVSNAFLFQAIVASLVLWSKPPGAFVLAALPVLTAAYNGLVLRPTRQFPYPALAHGLGILLALALRPNAPDAYVFLVVAPLAIGSSFAFGAVGERLARQRALLDDHRLAIEVQSLEERTLEARHLVEALYALLERNHEASSALSSALLEGDALVKSLATSGAATAGTDLAQARALRSDVVRLAQTLRPAEGELPEEAAPPVPTPLHPVVDVVLAEARRRFPEVRITGPGSAAESREPSGPAVQVRGGSTRLESLLAGLLANACEGDGRNGATSVRLDLEESGPEVRIRIRDDGPGFPPEVLEGPVTAFVTTKPRGSGLGLYIGERLARASGGRLELSNAPDGGALVTLRLQRAAVSSPAQ
jgi:signal transduction histidine kinase